MGTFLLRLPLDFSVIVLGRSVISSILSECRGVVLLISVFRVSDDSERVIRLFDE